MVVEKALLGGRWSGTWRCLVTRTPKVFLGGGEVHVSTCQAGDAAMGACTATGAAACHGNASCCVADRLLWHMLQVQACPARSSPQIQAGGALGVQLRTTNCCALERAFLAHDAGQQRIY